MTHIDKVMAFGQRVADNLNTMGVEAELNDGALTLADKILDIGSDNLTTSLTLSSDAMEYYQYDTINLTATLQACKTGTIDLNGTLEGATVTFKKGNTILQNSITNANGVASISIPDAEVGIDAYNAYFTRVGEYGNANSNILILQVKANYLATVYRNRNNYYYNGASPNFTSFENGILTATTNSGSVILTPFTENTDWEISFDLWIDKAGNGFFYLGSNPCFSVGKNLNGKLEFQRNTSGTKTILEQFENFIWYFESI